MIDTGRLSQLAPDALFVIACPVCREHVAATGSLRGLDACCPLCANLFRVPGTAAAQPSLAEDWGGVIQQLTPPSPPPGPAIEYPRMSYVFGSSAPAGSSDDTVGHAEAELPITAASTYLPSEPPPPAAADVPPADSTTATEPSAVVESAILMEEFTPDAADLVGLVVASDAPATVALPEGILPSGPALLEPTDAELELHEPVRTIRRGDSLIEIRRLTPEERRARRFRRNLMMIVIGVSILFAIVMLFGVPEKPSK